VSRQVYQALCYQAEADKKRPQAGECPSEERAAQITLEFLDRIPAIRDRLAGDVQARTGVVRTRDGVTHEGNVTLNPLGGLLVALHGGGTAGS
jgi:hypothetical protein